MIIASHSTYTPLTREIAHKIKGETEGGTRIPDNEYAYAQSVAASEMARFVNKGDILIPIPSRKGYATHTLDLANAIAKITGAEVKDIMKGKDRQSSYETKKEGKTLSTDDFGFHLTEPVGGSVVYIDNVASSGATARAAEACHKGNTLVYVSTGGRENPRLNEPRGFKRERRMIRSFTR